MNAAEKARTARLINSVETVRWEARRLYVGDDLLVIEEALGLAIDFLRSGKDAVEHLRAIRKHLEDPRARRSRSTT